MELEPRQMSHVELAPHQQEAVNKLRNGSILWGGVGTGKSRTALAYYSDTEPHEDLYIITTAKKRDSLDWEGEAASFGIGKEEGATLYGKLVVDSWNNLGRYVDVAGAFFIFDEQRLVGSGAWSRHFLRIARHNNWILLSATPGDTWMDYIPVFVANGYYRNRTEFLRRHVVFNSWTRYPKVERYLDEAHLMKLRREVLVEMKYKRKTERVSKNIKVEYDQSLMRRITNDRWHIYENRPLRDAGEMFLVMRKLVNSDPSRYYAVKEICRRKARVIIFYNFNFELEILRKLGYTYNVAEWNGHKHEPIPDTDGWVYLVQYTAGAEGWNCTTSDTIIFYSLPYSYRLYHQAHGRIDRMSTSFSLLFYHNLISDAKIDQLIKGCLDAKKSFNENSFKSDGFLT